MDRPTDVHEIDGGDLKPETLPPGPTRVPLEIEGSRVAELDPSGRPTGKAWDYKKAMQEGRKERHGSTDL